MARPVEGELIKLQLHRSQWQIGERIVSICRPTTLINSPEATSSAVPISVPRPPRILFPAAPQQDPQGPPRLGQTGNRDKDNPRFFPPDSNARCISNAC